MAHLPIEHFHMNEEVEHWSLTWLCWVTKANRKVFWELAVLNRSYYSVGAKGRQHGMMQYTCLDMHACVHTYSLGDIDYIIYPPMCACVIYDICLRVATPKGIIHPLTLVFHVDLSILSGESEAHATPEILSRVCSGASAATGCRDTTPRIATTVASAPEAEPGVAPQAKPQKGFFQSKFATINP